MSEIPKFRLVDKLDKLHEANINRVRRWHPGFPDKDEWTLADWSNAMAGEAGEACNIVKKIRRLDTSLKGRPTEEDRARLLEALGFEIADVIIYADLLLAKEGLELWPFIRDKFNLTSEEYGFPERLR